MKQLNNVPGTTTVLENKIFVTCGKNSVEVKELQLEGKKPMDAKTFLTGYKNFTNAKLE